jgi:hypothetical protein
MAGSGDFCFRVKAEVVGPCDRLAIGLLGDSPGYAADWPALRYESRGPLAK